MTSVLIPKAVDNLDITLLEAKNRVANMLRWMFPLTIVLVLLSPIVFPIVYDANFKDSA